jgi:hypothetical protein
MRTAPKTNRNIIETWRSKCTEERQGKRQTLPFWLYNLLFYSIYCVVIDFIYFPLGTLTISGISPASLTDKQFCYWVQTVLA